MKTGPFQLGYGEGTISVFTKDSVRRPFMSQMQHVKVALVLLLFTVLGAIQHWRVNGDDLTSTYLACQLLATGQQSYLYSHDPSNFSLVGDPVWTALGNLCAGSWLSECEAVLSVR